MMFDFSSPRPAGEVLVGYGGGVNTVALLVFMWRAGIVPRAILMANPGSEWKATIAYRDTVMREWLAAKGWPPVVEVTRAEEGKHRERAWRLETLYEECWRIASLPSIAYGWKKCSLKYKAEPARWWLQRQPWAQAEGDAGRKIVKAIGYDADESLRIVPSFRHPWEAARLVPWYPLHAAGLDRSDCERLILDEGLPLPPASACTFCPNNEIEEWERQRVEEPEAFARALAMSERAAPGIEVPDVVGLMRRAPVGRRQLHVWNAGGYVGCRTTKESEMPCECAL